MLDLLIAFTSKKVALCVRVQELKNYQQPNDGIPWSSMVLSVLLEQTEARVKLDEVKSNGHSVTHTKRKKSVTKP